MAVRAPAPAQTAASAPASWAIERQPATTDARRIEGRAERCATWVLMYLAVLTTSLAIGASIWALGLIR